MERDSRKAIYIPKPSQNNLPSPMFEYLYDKKKDHWYNIYELDCSSIYNDEPWLMPGTFLTFSTEEIFQEYEESDSGVYKFTEIRNITKLKR